ncbi:MAG: hypothetical protein NVSMB21_01740 [Vulcanimicrobiaceae bacterium]
MVRAVVASVIATTVGLTSEECASIGDETPIDDGALGVDSLDLLKIARDVARFFDLYASGAEERLLHRRTVGAWVRTVVDATSDAPPALTFRTSGSTGEPVDCRHELSSLEAEIAVFAPEFADRTRVVGLVPRHHIFGFLFTAMLPERLRLPFVDLRGASVGQIHRTLRPHDLLVGFPLRFDDLAEARVPFASDIVAVTSTGPCRATTIDALRTLGLARMLEIYGSSQTAGIAYRSEPRDPYRLLPYWTLDSGAETIARADPRTAVVTTYALPDRIVRRDDGFDVVGRHDGAVTIGGINVFPARVAATIRAHPDVVDCVVRPMRANEGDRLKAFVVLRSEVAERPDVRATLRHYIDARLAPPERPKPVTYGSALPVDPLGKPADW